jgi:hypothetical protein
MGSDGSQVTADYTQPYTVVGSPRTLYYRVDAQRGATNELLYSYFIPKNATEANSKQYNVYYDDTNMSMVSNELTSGLTVYFANIYDIKNWVIAAIGGDSNAPLPAGSSTDPAIVSGKAYTLLQIAGGDIGSYGTITLDSTTGVISTTTATAPGTYTLYIRNNGSYNISEFDLTVTAGSGGECCPIPLNLKGLTYEDRAEVIAGNAIIVGPRRAPRPLLQSDRMLMLKAYAHRR